MPNPFPGLTKAQALAAVAASVGLADITALDFSGGSTGDVLTQQGDGSFALETPTPGGSVALDDLTDVDTSGGSTGDVLTQQSDGSFALETPTGGSGGTDFLLVQIFS